MSESRNVIQELESAVTELSCHALDLRKFSEGKRYEAIPYALQDILDAQIEVNKAIQVLIKQVREWNPEYLDPKLQEVMARKPDPDVIALLKERISAREEALLEEPNYVEY
jgi:hypothetical protein